MIPLLGSRLCLTNEPEKYFYSLVEETIDLMAVSKTSVVIYAKGWTEKFITIAMNHINNHHKEDLLSVGKIEIRMKNGSYFKIYPYTSDPTLHMYDVALLVDLDDVSNSRILDIVEWQLKYRKPRMVLFGSDKKLGFQNFSSVEWCDIKDLFRDRKENEIS